MNCVHCTFLNEVNQRICEICNMTLSLSISNDADEQINGLECDKCTFINDLDAARCVMCDSEMYTDALSSVPSNSCDDDESNFVSASSGTSLPEMEIEADTPKNDETAVVSKRSCSICYEDFQDFQNFFAMIECTHTFCRNCAINYFTIQITEKSILDCNCPVCDYPDLHSSNEDNCMTYFSLLIASLKPVLDENIMNLFEKKLFERALSSDPNFVWCIRCSYGFIMDRRMAVQCPHCKIRFCACCRKVWETQHFRVSCEQFAIWKKDNNPDVSKEAIMNYLQKNGIDCPKCKFKYDLSRGGCIHFSCSMCKYEFCFGCSQPFISGNKCNISLYCRQLGLHAHHSRNCYYYLRDKEIPQLQGLLEEQNIPFMTKKSYLDAKGETSEVFTLQNNPLRMESAFENLRNVSETCPIELQLEEDNGLVDTTCKEPSQEDYAGLCRKHYSEYLIMKIKKAKLETLSILTLGNYYELLKLEGIDFRNRSPNEPVSHYQDACKKFVKKYIPLE